MSWRNTESEINFILKFLTWDLLGLTKSDIFFHDTQLMLFSDSIIVQNQDVSKTIIVGIGNKNFLSWTLDHFKTTQLMRVIFTQSTESNAVPSRNILRNSVLLGIRESLGWVKLTLKNLPAHVYPLSIRNPYVSLD